MVCAPLIDTEGNAFGVLQIDTFDQRNRFQVEDLEVLVSVASQAAISIDNAQLHEAALRQRDSERDLELAHVVQTLGKDMALRARLGKAAREGLERFYTAEQHVDRYLDHIGQLQPKHSQNPG